MKKFNELVSEQKQEVNKLRLIIEELVKEKVIPNNLFIGALLTGSVARGDARLGPFGIHIDLALVVKDQNNINLDEIFGKDEEPYIPYHCINITEKIGIAIEILEEQKLHKIREQRESNIFAKNESIIIFDRVGKLEKWKKSSFIISEEQIKTRALNNYFRYLYLTNDYRFEKWNYRKAYIQINQNFNEANECYCNFLFCINKSFIPRKDWLTYLTYNLEIKPSKHSSFMNKLYMSALDIDSINDKNKIMDEIKIWMEDYCKQQNWIT